MQLEVTRIVDVHVPQSVTWALLRDLARLSACIPRLSDLQVIEADQHYTGVVSDKLGPFSLKVPVRIDVLDVDAPSRITAALAGDDQKGQARVRGTLEALAEATDDGTCLTLSMRVEVLGKLASLGASPMRRRADDLFSTFVENVRVELGDALPVPIG
jgi:carbon monoxide dehydrogenase subunit G